MASRFELSGISLPEGEDPLGVWDVAEPAVSFAVSAAAPEPPTWRVALPDDPEAGEVLLARREQRLTWSRRDLARAAQEVTALRQEGAVAFAAPDDPLQAEKAALWETVAALQQPVSFDAQLRTDAEQRALTEQWERFVARIRDLVSHYARIQTTVGGVDVGLTRVGWTGDFETRWSAAATTLQMQRHRDSVGLALGSRMALMRLVNVVVSGAAGLALRASIPGGQVLLLPATWRFVRDVLKELRAAWPEIQAGQF
jgi:hypothetical protein